MATRVVVFVLVIALAFHAYNLAGFGGPVKAGGGGQCRHALKRVSSIHESS
jgi:hypothetical protein